MPITLKDIANHLGLSIPTVSRALAGYEDISPKTRERVQRAAHEMGYEPNIAALSLQKRRTNTISLILPGSAELQVSNPFFSTFLASVLERLAANNFDLNVSISAPENELDTYLRQIRSRRAAGFIIVRTQRHDRRIDLLKEHQAPFVAFGRVEGENDFHLIDEDSTDGIRQMVTYLVGIGHTRLACITEPLHNTKGYHRLQGFLEGLEEHNLHHDPELIIETNYRRRDGHMSALRLLNRPSPPTAIVACNDLLAVGAIAAAQELGLTVGRDVSITGFDDILLAEYTNPPLTTVHQPVEQLGMMVAQMLLQLIRQEPITDKQVIVKPSLIIRQSTGPLI